MNRGLCLIHANCQGEPLGRLLARHPDFGPHHEIRLFVNYLREPVPDADLARAEVFIHQWLPAPGWGEIASEKLLAKLPAGCRTVCIPNLFFKGYWPLWISDPDFDYSDRLLDELIGRGLSPMEILHLYLRSDITRYADLDALFEESLDRERDKERHWDFPMVDMVMDGWKKRRLFETVNHPCRELMLHMACETARLLGLPDFPEAVINAAPRPFPEFELPIHPQVAAHFGLDFPSDDDRWEVYGCKRTFEEYVHLYLECKEREITDFIGFLRVTCSRG